MKEGDHIRARACTAGPMISGSMWWRCGYRVLLVGSAGNLMPSLGHWGMLSRWLLETHWFSLTLLPGL